MRWYRGWLELIISAMNKLKARLHLALNAHQMSIQCVSIASALQMKNKLDQMQIKPIHFWRCIGSGLEWNVSICIVVCLHFCCTWAMTQMLTGNYQGHAHIHYNHVE